VRDLDHVGQVEFALGVGVPYRRQEVEGVLP
jgi:hypothetical protein